jgi:hypothetical protein
LAAVAGIDPEKVLQIEYDPHVDPEPDAVRKLAEVFGVASRHLLELAGLVKFRTPHCGRRPFNLPRDLNQLQPYQKLNDKHLDRPYFILEPEIPGIRHF